MTPTEWRKTEIKLKQKVTRALNASRENVTLREKIELQKKHREAQSTLHDHRINYFTLVTP